MIKKCTCCGRKGNFKSSCKFKNYRCDVCKKQGHLATICHARENNSRSNESYNNNKSNGTDNYHGRGSKNVKSKSNNSSHNYLDEILKLDESFDKLFAIDEEQRGQENENITDSYCGPIKIKLLIQEQQMELELDTGSPISAIFNKEFTNNNIFKNLKLYNTERKFKSYTGSPILPLGILNVEVTYKDQSRNLELFVLPGASAPIMGRQWIRALSVPLADESNNSIQNISDLSKLSEEILNAKFPTVLTDQLGLYKQRVLKLELREDVNPIFVKPRALPYAMISRVDKEIERLLADNIIFAVKSSDWATPVVPIIKANDQLRLCGDYKMTINKFMQVDRHPIPRISDLLAKINTGKYFSRIDLSHAYQQVELDDKSKLLTTISTHRGLFAYKRLCFGVASAPGFFQRLTEKVLFDIPGVIIFFDDILVFGSTWSEHDTRLLLVLEMLKDSGLTAKLSKCELLKTEIDFLGFSINGKGIHVMQDKVKAITQIKSPENVTELKCFLGMSN